MDTRAHELRDLLDQMAGVLADTEHAETAARAAALAGDLAGDLALARAALTRIVLPAFGLSARPGLSAPVAPARPCAGSPPANAPRGTTTS